MACENIVITIEETNEIISIIVNDFTVSNILSEDSGNSAVLGTDGKVYVPTPTVGAQNHSELNLDDGTNPHGTTKSDVGLGNADNTSDLLKPISNATQTALNEKANTIHSHVISGVTGLQNELNAKLSNDETTYTAATLPLAGTEVALLNDGTNWVKITWNNIISSLSSVFQVIEKLVTNSSVTGSYAIDWTNDVWDLTLTGNTTLTESNLPASGTTKTITLEISGNHTLTYPSGWTSKITGAYSGTATLNTITIQYYGVGKYKVLIVQPT